MNLEPRNRGLACMYSAVQNDCKSMCALTSAVTILRQRATTRVLVPGEGPYLVPLLAKGHGLPASSTPFDMLSMP